MATWGELLKKLETLTSQGRGNALDVIRRDAMTDLNSYTGRNVIVYAAAHLQKPRIAPELLSITNEDTEGFMEVFHGLKDSNLDIVLHSPGGSAEATEAIVKYIRSKFNNVRVFIPHEAMSAATMLACSANKIVMGKQSHMGPIDPQFQMITSLGPQSIPADAILSQFERAKKECAADKSNLAVWLPSLQQYGPALLEQCEDAKNLSQQLVSSWLASWMLNSLPEPEREQQAKDIAAELCDHDKLLTHGRPIDRNQLRQWGMIVDDLENDQQLQDKILTVYHACMHTFSASAVAKIIENHKGQAFLKVLSQPLPLQLPVPVPPPPRPIVPSQPIQHVPKVSPVLPSSSPPTPPASKS